jgi:hypothetical protein
VTQLSEKGIQEANDLVEHFKKKLTKAAEETICSLYVDIMPHIETDSWLNYREQLRIELQQKYVVKETATSEEAWAMMVREAIYSQFKEDLQNGIIRDLERRIDTLEQLLERRGYS